MVAAIKPKRSRRTLAEQRLTDEERDLIEIHWIPRLPLIRRMVARKLPTADRADVDYQAILLLARWAKYAYVDLANPRTITMLTSSCVREVKEEWATNDRIIRLPRVDASTPSSTREKVAEWRAVARIPLEGQHWALDDPGAEVDRQDFVDAVLDRLSPDARRLIDLVMEGRTHAQAAILLGLSDARLAELLAEAVEAYFACDGDDD